MRGLTAFIVESNKIEGLHHLIGSKEIEAYEQLLQRSSVYKVMLLHFVQRINGGPLRNKVGMDVRVGKHLPPPGGPLIVRKLERILESITTNNGPPWLLHREYERLHPFMDGNGRSGRALWAWQILHHDIWPRTLELGFLHPAYYAALEATK